MDTLTDYMKSKGLNDAALAARVECDRSMITRIRNGRVTPSLHLAVAISKETGVPVERLIASVNA